MNLTTDFASRLCTCCLLACALLLSACGGGGGGGGDNNAAPTAPPAPPTPPTEPPSSPTLTAVISAPSTAISLGKVKLDGTLSSDPDGQITSYQWRQTSGPAVTLEQGSDGSASFIAPESAGVVTVELTVSDNSGSSASVSSDVIIVAASAARSTVELISARLAMSIPDGGHTDYSEIFGAPRGNAAMLALVTLGGPVDDTVRFSLVSDTGVELGVLNLEAVSDPAVQPTTFAGEFIVPSQRFKIRAAGQSRREQQFDLVSTAFTPSGLIVQFDPSFVRGTANATRSVRLSITNSGAADSFTIQFIDTANVVAKPAASVRAIQSGETVSIDLQATVPAMSRAYESVVAQVSSSKDANSEQLRVWQEVAP